MGQEVNKPVDPYDPHHVTLQLVIDLQSTNLTRQKEILRLRDEVGKARVAVSEEEREKNELQRTISGAIAFLEKPPLPDDAREVLLRMLKGEDDDEQA